MFFRSILGEKDRKCGTGGRKSTYCYTTDIQPTAQQDKLSLNPLQLLLIDCKYVLEVGKLSRRFIPAAFWAKKSEMWIWGTKIDDATDFQPAAQQDKLGINLL